MLTPSQFGLPPKFRDWRPGQLDAINQIIDSRGTRFQVVCAPTGFGKSLMYMAAAKMSGVRTMVLTSTKGLQDQLNKDFGGISNDIRGQSNYPCTMAAEFGMPGHVTVDMGPCKGGAKCALKTNGCEYYDRYAQARVADIVVGNYALWMYDTLKGGDEASRDGNLMSKRPVEMLILDEAHDAPEQLSGFVGEELRVEDLSKAKLDWPGIADGDREGWQSWAAAKYIELDEFLTSRLGIGMGGSGNDKNVLTPDEMRRVAACKKAHRKLHKIARMSGEWIIETKSEYAPGGAGRRSQVVHFDPLWPRLYAESALFRKVPKIILVSATVRPKTADVLGVPVNEVTFREYGSSFPAKSRPTIHVPTVQMNHRITDFGLMVWLGMIDRILDGRTDRKGIIHTVSYDRAKLIQLNSRHGSRMILHDSKNRQAVVERFKTTSEPTILVSPSLSTGYDFPYKECEYQIIAKLPFPDNRAKVIKRRMETDKEYSNYMTAQVLVQTSGRGSRAADDSCETLVVDDNIGWFVRGNRKFFPKWWLEAYGSVENGQVPIALEKLL